MTSSNLGWHPSSNIVRETSTITKSSKIAISHRNYNCGHSSYERRIPMHPHNINDGGTSRSFNPSTSPTPVPIPSPGDVPPTPPPTPTIARPHWNNCATSSPIPHPQHHSWKRSVPYSGTTDSRVNDGSNIDPRRPTTSPPSILNISVASFLSSHTNNNTPTQKSTNTNASANTNSNTNRNINTNTNIITITSPNINNNTHTLLYV